MSNHLARYFAHLAENLCLVATQMDLDAIHTIEIIPGMLQCWWIHINGEQFMQVQRNALGECEIALQAWYSDFFEDSMR